MLMSTAPDPFQIDEPILNVGFILEQDRRWVDRLYHCCQSNLIKSHLRYPDDAHCLFYNVLDTKQ